MGPHELLAMDARVHRVVFGYAACPCPRPHESGYFPDTGECRRCGWRVCPSYSTEMTAAWRVVDAMGAAQFELVHLAGGDWSAEFWTPDGSFKASAASAPVAICKAALAMKAKTQ